MRKYFIGLFFVFCICFVPFFGVYAADVDTDISGDLPDMCEKDDVGRFTSGRVSCSYFNKNNNLPYNATWTITPNTKVSYIYIVVDEYGVYNLYGVGNVHYEVLNIKNPNSDNPEKSIGSNNFSLSKYASGNQGVKLSFPFSDYPEPIYSTNLPVFKYTNTDAIESYEKTGDVSGSENIKYSDEEDPNIPIPHNLKVVSGADQSVSGSDLEKITNFNKDIVLTWEQEDLIDGLQFEIEGEFSANRISDGNYTEYKEHTGVYTNVVPKTNYGDTKTITVQIAKQTLNAKKEKGFLTKLNLRVRNCVNGKTSGWVLVTIDIRNRTATATQQSYEDNSSTGGDEYNDSDVDGSDNSTKGIDTSNISFSSLTGFIKNGFGLIGSGGILTLMSRTFTFLPGTFWTIIYFFVSMMVVVCCIKLIKDLIM